MKVEVLGNVQDGGVPHLGCECEVCEAAREDANNQKYVGALMLRENNEKNTVRYLIDATPDIKYQIKGDYLDGVFVSHGHMGHIAGLPFFGTESLDTDDLPVYCTPEMRQFIMNNDPFRLLVDRNQIDINETKKGEEVEIQGGTVEMRNVLHRYVNTDTVSFMIEGGEKKLFYMSDIDEWTDETKEYVEEADIAIVDGTFWSKEELDRYEEVPHPPINESMDLFEDLDTDIYFIHMNHTNPVLRKDSEEYQELQDRGFDIVEKGDTFEI